MKQVIYISFISISLFIYLFKYLFIDFVSRNQDFQKFVATIASSTNQRLGNGDFDANQILDLQTLESQTPTTIRHLLGDITTAIRFHLLYSLSLL